MTQKDEECIIFKKFLELRKISFALEKLNLECKEPADLEYDGHGYQITTGAGERIGEILSSIKKFNLTDVEHRSTSRESRIENVVEEDLRPILEKKKLSASKSVILIVSITTIDPFSDEDRNNRYKLFCKQKPELVNSWQEVYSIVCNKQLIKLFP